MDMILLANTGLLVVEEQVFLQIFQEVVDLVVDLVVLMLELVMVLQIIQFLGAVH